VKTYNEEASFQIEPRQIVIELPEEFEELGHQPLPKLTYQSMTMHIYHSIDLIKKLGRPPEIPPDKIIDFKFKKPGFGTGFHLTFRSTPDL